MTFHSSSVLIPTALLICMENSFWRLSGESGDASDHDDDNLNFVELFKKSFTLYVESGMRGKVEADIDILRNQGLVDDDEFKAQFCKIIIEHLLRKFHSFFAHDKSNHFHIDQYSPPCFRVGN